METTPQQLRKRGLFPTLRETSNLGTVNNTNEHGLGKDVVLFSYIIECLDNTKKR